jgi:O-antigen ligase
MSSPAPSLLPETRLPWDEALFWLLLTMHSLLPARWQPAIEVLGCPVISYDVAFVLGAVALVALRWRALRFPPGLWWQIGLWFAAVVVWGALSVVLWAPARDPADALGRMMPVIGGAAGFAAAYALVAGRPPSEARGVAARAALFLAAIGLAYSIKSLFAANLGIAMVRDTEQRARGTLFGPAIGHVALLPALGMAAGCALDAVGRARVVWGVAAIALLGTVLALGSRGALLGLAIFAVLAVVRVRGARQRAVLVLGVGLAAGLAAAIWALAPQERLAESGDVFRERTYATAFTALADQPAESVRGQGLGAVWPWYAEDAERAGWEGSEANFAFWRATRWGDSMMHPHSLPLLLTVELGLVGFALILALLFTLGRQWMLAVDTSWTAGLATGLAASTAAIALDMPLLKHYPLAALWWIMLLGLVIHREAAQEDGT